MAEYGELKKVKQLNKGERGEVQQLNTGSQQWVGGSTAAKYGESAVGR